MKSKMNHIPKKRNGQRIDSLFKWFVIKGL